MSPLLFSAWMLMVPQSDGGTVTLKGNSFQAEVAWTDEARGRGLMYRQSLSKDRCMFFWYENDYPKTIWMKNCLISLDVLWVTAEGRVVELLEQVPPCSPLLGTACPSYGGSVDSRYFVEFAAGTFRRLGVKKGDRIGWDLRLSNGSRIVGGTSGPKAK